MNHNQQLNQSNQFSYIQTPGFDYSAYRELVVLVKEFEAELADSSSKVKRDPWDKSDPDSAEFLAQYNSMIRSSKYSKLGITDSYFKGLITNELSKKYRERGGILKISSKDIKSPPYPGSKNLLGLLLPLNVMLGLEGQIQNRTVSVRVFKKDRTIADLFVQLNIGDYEEATSTFELGQLLLDSEGMLIDFNVKDYSKVYDPSLEF